MTIVRPETPDDQAAIADITTRAFARTAYGSGNEAAIINRLRADHALALSLVAEEDGAVVGHVAFSPMTGETGWFALGPVSVAPERQGQGIGSLLIRSGLDILRSGGASGCALVGNPAFYRRFGFEPAPSHVPPGLPAAYFMLAGFGGPWPRGPIAFAEAFSASHSN